MTAPVHGRVAGVVSGCDAGGARDANLVSGTISLHVLAPPSLRPQAARPPSPLGAIGGGDCLDAGWVRCSTTGVQGGGIDRGGGTVEVSTLYPLGVRHATRSHPASTPHPSLPALDATRAAGFHHEHWDRHCTLRHITALPPLPPPPPSHRISITKTPLNRMWHTGLLQQISQCFFELPSERSAVKCLRWRRFFRTSCRICRALSIKPHGFALLIGPSLVMRYVALDTGCDTWCYSPGTAVQPVHCSHRLESIPVRLGPSVA